MSKHVPQHRAPRHRRARAVRPRGALRSSVVLSSVAVAATGVTVSGGMVASGSGDGVGDASRAQAHRAAPQLTSAALTDRLDRRTGEVVSRSGGRLSVDATKAAALEPGAGEAITRTEDLSDAEPREIARALLPEYGWDTEQYQCLDALYISESNWQVTADNPTSSAYGIPQALTSTHDLPPGYMHSAEVQIRWGLQYIESSYGTPCNAWSFKQGHNWY